MNSISGSTILKKRNFNDLWWLYVIVLLMLLSTLISFLSSTSMDQDVPPGLFGYRFFRVSGVSMEPTIVNGSILIVKQTAPDMIQKNDIITYLCYRGQKACTTHRVIDIERLDNDRRQFITRGDGNSVKDPVPIPQDQVVGVVKQAFTANDISSGFKWIGLLAISLLIIFIYGRKFIYR